MLSEFASEAQEWFAQAQAHGYYGPKLTAERTARFTSTGEEETILRKGWRGFSNDMNRQPSSELFSPDHDLWLNDIPLPEDTQVPFDLISTVDGSEVHLEFSSSDDKLYLLAFWKPEEVTSKSGIHYLDGYLGRNPQWTDKIEVILISVGQDAALAQATVALKAWTHFKSFIFNSSHEQGVSSFVRSYGMPCVRLIRHNDCLGHPSIMGSELAKAIEKHLRDPRTELTEEQFSEMLPQIKEAVNQFKQANPQLEAFSADFTRGVAIRTDGSAKYKAELTVQTNWSSKNDAAVRKLTAELKAAFPLEVNVHQMSS
jgi:hypothetical protein